MDTKLVEIARVDAPVLCTTENGHFTLDFEARIHKSSPLLVASVDDPKYCFDYEAGERLSTWLSNISYVDPPPRFYTSQGDYLIVELTEEDAMLFRVFFC